MLTVQTEEPYINLSYKVVTTVIANKVHSKPKCAHQTRIRHFESRMRRRGSLSVFVRSYIEGCWKAIGNFTCQWNAIKHRSGIRQNNNQQWHLKWSCKEGEVWAPAPTWVPGPSVCILKTARGWHFRRHQHHCFH